MVALYNWGTTTQHSRLPPTPPDYQTAYLTSMNVVTDQSYYSTQSYHPRKPQSGRDFIDRFAQVPAYAAQQALSAKNHSRVSQLHTQDYHNPVSYGPQVQSQYHYVTAPLLPPIRTQDTIDPYAHQYVPVVPVPEPKPKEEKATGGVAAHLDYDMDLMSSFVAEMSQGMYAILTSGLHVPDIDLMRSVSPGVSPTSQYRKYVSQILSSTRLPSSTIMLGMFYLASRMKIVAARGDEVHSTGTVYRMLTICLLL